ncbi:zinc finger BED domain-containing protein RICESLEEPER [Trifolium repens]|nr:zinc finger BED domain-containing protein RICESLEEPER [Trifolium repens]
MLASSFNNSYNGIQFIESNFTAINDDKQHRPIGFDILFPSLIEYAQTLGINLPIGATSLEAIIQKKDKELQRTNISSGEVLTRVTLILNIAGTVFAYGVTSSGKTHTMHLISEMAESVGNGNLPVESNVDGVPNANQLEEAQPQLGVEEGLAKKPKLLKSDCWKFFTIVEDGKDGIGRAKCNTCKKEYKCGGKLYGTSSLNRHILSCQKSKYGDVGKMIIDMDGKIRQRNIDQMISREMCAAAIIEHDLPFKFVEYRKIRNWIKYLNPDAVPITRNTAKSDVLKIYMREKSKLKSEMATSKIINFCHMPPPHTGAELSKKILGFLSDWGIEKKIFSLTLDNCSANDVMQEKLKSQLAVQNWLSCDGQFFHVRCSAHILNLIVQEGLKVASEALNKIRDSIKYLRGSEGRMKKLKECIEKIGGLDTSAGLCFDVPTRFCPSAEEWKRGEKICVFLHPFYETTKLISGTSYPTSNLYFLQVWKIQCVLIDSLSDEDVVIKDMAKGMLTKFEKYWDEYSIVLALGAVLDPCIKLSSLSYCYSKVDASTSESKIEEVKKKLYMLFDKYTTKRTAAGSTEAPSSMDSATKSFSHNLIHGLKVHNHNFHRFSDLSLMARDLLGIPITTVASESTFSIGSIVFNKYRNRLLSGNVEALICTRNWMHGFVGNDDDDEDDGKEASPSTFKQASTSDVNLD